MIFKYKVLLILILLLSINLVGCSSVNYIDSVIDHNNITDFNKILVMFRTDSIRITKEVEGSLVKNLEKNNIKGYASYKEIPLTRTYNEEEFSDVVLEVIEKNNINGILLINIDDFFVSTNEINTNQNNSYNNSGALTAFVDGYTSVAGTEYQTLDLYMSARLVNTFNEAVAWRAEANANHNNFSGENDLINILKKASEHLVDKLKSDNLI